MIKGRIDNRIYSQPDSTELVLGSFYFIQLSDYITRKNKKILQQIGFQKDDIILAKLGIVCKEDNPDMNMNEIEKPVFVLDIGILIFLDSIKRYKRLSKEEEQQLNLV